MSDRRSFLKRFGLLLATTPLLPSIIADPTDEVTESNSIKELPEQPVQLGVSNRGNGIERPPNSWRDKIYIAEFEPRRCMYFYTLANGKRIERWGTCDSYQNGAGMVLAGFRPDNSDDSMPELFMITMGRFEDGTPMWKDILQYPKFKERYPKLFDTFQTMKQNEY